MTTRAAFTLTELLIVMAVLAAIAALSYPALLRSGERSRIDATRSLVAAAWTALEGEEDRLLHVLDASGNPIVLPRWDLDRDGVLDGDPTLWTGAAATRAAAAGYRGFLEETGAPIGSDHRDPAGHVIDAWGRPLRVQLAAFPLSAGLPSHPDTGGAWGGVWSLGPDGEALTADDIRSWDAGGD